MTTVRELAERAVREHGAIQLPEELAAVGGLLPSLRNVLEIGCRFGGTLWFWSQVAPTARILGLDLDVEQFAAPIDRSRVEVLKADSQMVETRSLVDRWFDHEPLDLVFVDGDHSVEAVLRDHEIYWSLVRTGGAMAFHDVREDPSGFWESLHRDCPGDKMTVFVDRVGWGLPNAAGYYPGWGSRLGIGVMFK